jgi:hypothetical protein
LKMCQHEADQSTQGECGSFANGPRVEQPISIRPGPEPLWVKLPSPMDNDVSYIEVTATVSAYREP